MYLLTTKKYRPATVNLALAALKFLYGTTLGMPEVTRGMRQVRRTFPAPDVLSGSEVHSVLEHACTLKHRAMFMLMYGAGLRISEVRKLSASDIDSKRMVVLVRAPKNRHDRIVPLAPRTLEVLREYWRQYRPRGEYLFASKDEHRPLTRGALYLALKKAAGRARLTKRVYPHLLRQAFATHSLELGTDIRTVQILLGHLSLKSTTRYTHLSEARRLALKLPVQALGTEEGRVLG
jgi:site-specific recombinase XerD